MKKTIIACLSLTLFSGFAIAQTQVGSKTITKHYDPLKAEELSKEVSEFEEANFKEAMRLAKKHNWPLSFEYEDGRLAQLVGVQDGKTPKYYTTYNKGGVYTIHADKVHTGGSLGLDINGEGMLVGVWDANTVLLSHQSFEGRATKRDNHSSTHHHSTHVTGTIIGSKAFVQGNAIGVAHKASAITYDWFNDTSEMISAAQNDALLVSNHSYGLATLTNSGQPTVYPWYFGQYNADSRTLDQMLYQFEYYLPVYAAGNDRGYHSLLNPGKQGYDLLTDETNAKNNLVVASAYEVLNYTSPNSVTLSNFSNFGPTDDGRVKPDITAKGHNVYSATNYSNTAYDYYDGTSMAAPSIAGGITLIQQYAYQQNNAYYRSATIRALVAHTAYKAGPEGNPNYRYGWGVMDVATAIQTVDETNTSTRVDELVLRQGEEYMTTIVADGQTALIGTIAWTDMPGTTNSGPNNEDSRSPRLVNDLDLRLVATDGTVNYPFVLNPELPRNAPGKGDNIRDNIEKIEILAPEGEYNLVVSHKGSLQGTNSEQKFSLVLSGIEENPFVLETYKGNLTFCANGGDEGEIVVYIKNTDLTNTFDIQVDNLPTDLNATIDDSTIATDGYFKVLFDGISDLSSDNYRIDISVESDGNIEKISPTINVTNDEFTPVVLTSPENGKDRVVNTIKLEWDAHTNNRVQTYTLQVSDDADFQNIVFERTGLRRTYEQYHGFQTLKDYYWRVKAVGECGDGEWSTTYVFYTYDKLSVEDIEREEALKIYPNPTSGVLNIQAANAIEKIELYNILGQLVVEQNPSKTDVQLNLAGLARGNYILKVKDSEGTTIKKIVLN